MVIAAPISAALCCYPLLLPFAVTLRRYPASVCLHRHMRETRSAL